MPPERHRGRRSAPSPQVQSKAEREIRALQDQRNDLLEDLDAKLTQLAVKISEHMKEGVGTAEIGTWLTSEQKPQGVTRQQVYKLVAERVDGKDLRVPATAKLKRTPQARPRPVARPRPS